MNRIAALPVLLVFVACAPVRLQHYSIDGVDKQGRTIYRMDGYGEPYEMAPKSSTPIIQEALSDVCPGGAVILTQLETPSGSMLNSFLYWRATARCK